MTQHNTGVPAPATTGRDGQPCPPWCVTDHRRFSGHESSNEHVSLPAARGTFGAYAIAFGGDAPRLAVFGGVPGTRANFSLRDDHGTGEDVAGFIELLAEATPDQHRALAALVRAAAAVVAGDAR